MRDGNWCIGDAAADRRGLHRIELVAAIGRADDAGHLVPGRLQAPQHLLRERGLPDQKDAHGLSAFRCVAKNAVRRFQASAAASGR